MPLYEYCCDRCQKEVSVTQSMSEHAGEPSVPVRQPRTAATPGRVLLQDLEEVLNHVAIMRAESDPPPRRGVGAAALDLRARLAVDAAGRSSVKIDRP